MSDAPENPHLDASEPGSSGRLDTWKEIAAYLRRSVRSARRWEKEEGLPVRRHVHRKGDSVFAYKTELDDWWNNRGAKLGDENAAEEALPPEPDVTDGGASAVAPGSTEGIPPPSLRRSRRVAWIEVGFVFAALLVGVVAWLSRNGSPPARVLQPLPFQARDWVLITSFENRTGEPLFDGTLEYALTRELANSRYVNVVPRARVEDALRLMRKPLNARIDAALGREICIRDGGIRALLTGRVEKPGSKYLLSIEVVDPNEGISVAAFAERASDQEGSIAAVGRISDQVRKALGERPSPGASERPKLEKVTTSKLRALQLYSQADRLIREGNSAAAEELLKRTVAEDPEFASAFIHLAWALHNQGRPQKEFGPYAEAALRLLEGISDRERLFIRGSYYQLLGERKKAIAAYEALLSQYPDDAWALENLAEAYFPDLDFQKSVRLENRLAEVLPKRFDTNWNAGFNFVVWERDPARAEPYLRRARALVTPEVTAAFPWMVGWLQLLPFTDGWLKGDLEPAARELDRFAAELEPLGGPARDILAVKAASSYLTLGRIDAAERIAGKIFEPVNRNDMLAQIRFIEGDDLALRKHLRYEGKRGLVPAQGWAETLAILQARAGSVQQVRLFLKEPAEERGERTRASTKHNVSGELALEQGNLEAAIRELEEGARLQRESFPHQPGFYLGSESLAAALTRKGDLRRAIQVLERASAKRFEAVAANNAGAYWLRTRFDLARLYRKVGRVGDARAVEADLLKLLAMADADHPILRELQRLATS